MLGTCVTILQFAGSLKVRLKEEFEKAFASGQKSGAKALGPMKTNREKALETIRKMMTRDTPAGPDWSRTWLEGLLKLCVEGLFYMQK